MKVVQEKRSFLEVLFCKPVKTHVEWFNPLKAKVFSTFQFSKLDWEGRDYKVTTVREYTRTLDGKNHVFTDYNLAYHQAGEQLSTVKLRVVPVANAVQGYSGENTCILLNQEDTLEWDENIAKVIAEAQENKVWEVDLEGEDDGLKAGETQKIIYDRIDGVNIAYSAKTSILTPRGDGLIFTPDEVSYENLSYWDFWRVMQMEGGVKATEFFFIEMSQRTRRIDMWRGTEIAQDRITVV